jgi:hypothetical protein
MFSRDVNLEKLLNQNQVTLNNLSDLEQDMGKLLEKSDTLRYEDCENMTIKINSKINRIIFIRCKNFNVHLTGLISGMEIKNCQSVQIVNRMNRPVNSVIVENSVDICFKISKSTHKETVYEIDKSRNIKVKDHNDKQLKV